MDKGKLKYKKQQRVEHIFEHHNTWDIDFSSKYNDFGSQNLANASHHKTRVCTKGSKRLQRPKLIYDFKYEDNLRYNFDHDVFEPLKSKICHEIFTSLLSFYHLKEWVDFNSLGKIIKIFLINPIKELKIQVKYEVIEKNEEELSIKLSFPLKPLSGKTWEKIFDYKALLEKNLPKKEIHFYYTSY